MDNTVDNLLGMVNATDEEIAAQADAFTTAFTEALDTLTAMLPEATDPTMAADLLVGMAYEALDQAGVAYYAGNAATAAELLAGAIVFLISGRRAVLAFAK